MQCPIDQTRLQRTDRNGVEIDYCPKCRGVWLDRGELDKIIERSGSAYLSPTRPESRQATITADDRSQDNDASGRKRKSFLKDLFDV